MMSQGKLISEGQASAERFFEIDLLRGIAVAMMVFYHAAFDLSYFSGSGFVFESLSWWALARLTASIFIFLAGVSLAVSYAKAERTGNASFRKYASRGLKIFGLGMIVTLVTRMYLGEDFVVFGVLHFIGLSIILAYPILKMKRKMPLSVIAIAMLFVLAGHYFRSITASTPWLFWLGLLPAGSHAAYTDYFPVAPWFGLILLGIVAGNALYPEAKRKFRVREGLKEKLLARGLCFIGRNSLLIYLAHQPVLLFLMRALA